MIDKYLLSNCLFIIDEFNERYCNIENDKLKEIANEEYSEADLVVRLGYPFRHMATFNMQGKSRDIVVKNKDFIVEVKYLKNFKSNSNGRSNKITWSEGFEKDFNWLTDEIKEKNKGNRAFVIGWFNIKNRKFGDVMQIGTKSGQNPLINKDRISLFPFLNYNPKTCKTSDITYRYGEAFKELNISIAGVEEHVSCMFLGKETDLFHFAIYW